MSDAADPLPAEGPASAVPGAPRAAAIVLAGGSGTRLGADRNKVLLDLAGMPVLAHSLRTAASLAAVQRVVVVAREVDLDDVAALAARWAPGADVVVGGADRAASERAAFTVLADDVAAGRLDLVAVHDGARPLADAPLWRAVLAAAAEHGGALPARRLGPALALPPGDRRDGREGGTGSVVHDDLVAVSTPQAFAAGPLLGAYAAAEQVGFVGTDTSSYVEQFAAGVRVATVPDRPANLKVTWPGDLDRAERLLSDLA